MVATSIARFMHARTHLRELQFFKATTSTLVSEARREKSHRRSQHTPATATTPLTERSADRHLPFLTPGSGYYGQTLGRNTKKFIDDFSDFVLTYLDTVPVQDDGVFTVADYGTNDGSSSMTLMGRIIGQLRKKHERLPIQVIYEDQERNDFNSLFSKLSDGTGYLSEYSNVYPFATSVNFFNGTCDVIFTSNAVHFLEKLNVNFKDGFFHARANADSEELRRFHAEAERDWIKFLLLRPKELKKGGLLIALNISTADDFQGRSSLMGGEEKDRTSKSPISIQGTSMVDMMLDLDIVWRQLNQENIITQEEYQTCSVPAVFRKPKQEAAPFKAANSPVVEAGLSLVHHDQVFQGSFFKDLWRGKRSTEAVHDRAYFAELIAKSHMVALHTSFLNSLSDSRSAEDKEAILNELYKRFEARIVPRDPETYRADYILSRLVVRKV